MDSAGFGKRKIIGLIIVALLVSTTLVTFISQDMPWATLDTSIKTGAGDIRVNATITQHTINYTGALDSSGGGLGLGSSLGLDSGGQNISAEKEMLEGFDNFTALFGILIASYNNRTYKAQYSTWDASADVDVNLQTDRIPWFPAGMAQQFEARISLGAVAGNFDRIELEKLELRLYRDFDETSSVPDFTDFITLKTISMDDILRTQDDVVVLNLEGVNPRDERRVGYAIAIQAKIVDSGGNESSSATVPWSSNSHPPSINMIPTSQIETIQLALLVLAYPLSFVLIAFGLICVVPILLDRKKNYLLLISFAVFAWMIPLFFSMGGNTLVALLKETFTTFDTKSFVWQEGLTTGYMAAVLASAAAGLGVFQRVTMDKEPAMGQDPTLDTEEVVATQEEENIGAEGSEETVNEPHYAEVEPVDAIVSENKDEEEVEVVEALSKEPTEPEKDKSSEDVGPEYVSFSEAEQN